MTLEDSVLSLKQCKNCLRRLEKAAFPPGRAYCKECYSDRRKTHDVVWRSMLKHKYNITPEMHELMYQDQKSRCYFCDAEKPRRTHRGLVIDHVEVDGRPIVRGLLCRTCNQNFIDEYSDLPDECKDFQRANEYLRRGETGDYIESIKQRVESAEQA